MSKSKFLHHFDFSRKMVVGRKISHFFLTFTSLKQHNRALLKRREKKSIKKSIRSLTVFCFLKTSVFSFCLNTSDPFSHFTLSLEPLSASPTKFHCCCVCVSRSAGEGITLKYKQRCFLLLDSILQRMQRNKCDCMCAFVRLWSVTACWGKALREGELAVLSATAGLASSCLQGQHKGKN